MALWPNLLSHKETPWGFLCWCFRQLLRITPGCFLSLSYSQKEQIKKVKIFCLQNERKSFVEMRSGQQLGLCFVLQDLLMQGRAFGRALQGGGHGAPLLRCWEKQDKRSVEGETCNTPEGQIVSQEPTRSLRHCTHSAQVT